MAYGSAGPMLLPAVMEQVKIRRVIVPPFPGLFSALGLLSSDLVYTSNQSAYITLTPEAADKINDIYEKMENELRKKISFSKDVTFMRTFEGRLMGQTWETPFITVPSGRITVNSVNDMIANFHAGYQKRWGNSFLFLPVESVTYRTQAVIPIEKVKYKQLPKRESGKLVPERKLSLKFIYDELIEVNEYEREKLCSGDVIKGPAIIREPMTTIKICIGQIATVGRWGEIIIERSN